MANGSSSPSRTAPRLAEAGRLLEPRGVGTAVLDERSRQLVMPVTGGAEVLTEALRLLDGASIGLDDVGLRRPTLDDVFLSLTGHVTAADEAAEAGQEHAS